jgi:6-phosphofructo-2-kinase/fructose-2,6-biphosphatase 4
MRPWSARPDFRQSGQSQIEHSFKADSRLSDDGREYARQLKEFIVARRITSVAERRSKEGKSDEGERNLTVRRRAQDLPFRNKARAQVWTSARRRCVETTEPFRDAGIRVKTLSQLSEINPGVIDGAPAISDDGATSGVACAQA